MTYTWIEFAKDFQTAIVGVIGFAGVICTLWFNARSAESQRRREIESRADAVAAIVQAELEVLLGALLSAANAQPPDEGESTKFPRLKINFLPNVVDELGLLGPELCKKVLGAFLTVENTIAKVSLFAASFETEYLTVPKENFEFVSRLYDAHTGPLTEALESLKARKSAKA